MDLINPNGDEFVQELAQLIKEMIQELRLEPPPKDEQQKLIRGLKALLRRFRQSRSRIRA
jgi:hypothetical protein